MKTNHIPYETHLILAKAYAALAENAPSTFRLIHTSPEAYAGFRDGFQAILDISELDFVSTEEALDSVLMGELFNLTCSPQDYVDRLEASDDE